MLTLNFKEVLHLNKDNTKPISFKTVQKNKKLGDFITEELAETNPEQQID